MKNPNIDNTGQKILYIILFAQTITAVDFSSIFPFLPFYVKSLGATTGLSIGLLTGLVFSSQAFTMMIASPIWGGLADRWGRKLMVERAIFGGALLLGLMAFVRSAEELVLLRTIQGFITGTISASNALVAAAVPRERTGYAMGLLQVGMAVGIGIGPVIGGTIADSFGYRAAFFVTATLLLVVGMIVLFGVEEQFEPKKTATGQKIGFWSEWRGILTAKGVIIVYSLRFINQLGRNILVPVLPLFLLSLIPQAGRINSFTGLAIGVSMGATAVASVFLGRLGDRVGRRPILLVSFLSSAIFFYLQSRVSNGMQFLVLQIFTGITMGGIVPAISALLAQYTQSGEEGAVYGLDNSITSGARAAGPMLGVGIAAWLGFRGVFVFTALISLVAGLLVFWGISRPASGNPRPTNPMDSP
ncbi:MFS transporter [Thermodesulfobacteriota bacterium]